MNRFFIASLLASALFALAPLAAEAANEPALLAKAEAATAQAAETDPAEAGEETGETAEDAATLYPGVPQAMLEWEGSGFYPNEFCWQITSLEPTFPQYWAIRRWCDKQEQRDDWL